MPLPSLQGVPAPIRRRPTLVALAVLSLVAGCATPAPGGGGPKASGAPAAAPAGAAAAPSASVPPAPAATPRPPAGAVATGQSGARPPAAAVAGAPTGAVPPPAAAGQPPGSPRPFADVVKDARKLDGVFTLYQKDDKVWLELAPSDFGQPFVLSPKLKTGIGQGRLIGGLMGEEVVVEFRRIHNNVQMLARNTEFTARAGTPERRSVDDSFSPSLLGSAPVLSQPHPERKSILVEMNSLVLTDMMGLGLVLQRQFRQGYAFDGRNSAIATVRNGADVTVLEVLSHFYTANIAVPQPPAPGQPAPPPSQIPTTPRAVPDARSLFLTLHYSFAKLPAQPMRPRASDPRIGYFTSSLMDYSDDLARTPRVRHINRWRLEKKDPSAEVSEPVTPITFWIDRNVPEKYRASVIAGVLEWNKAFERIGFRNAVRAEIQPDDATWDTLDFGRASIRWMTSAVPTFGGIGPSHVDPRTGEILDADIGLESLSSRNLRAFRSGTVGAPGALAALASGLPQAADADVPAELAARGLRGQRHCLYGDIAAEQLAYTMEVMDTAGVLDADSPEAEQFVQAYMKDVTMHEVGHTLGLRHNFRASRIWTQEQLRDPEFVARNGLAGSVMEYSPINLPSMTEMSRMGGTAWRSAFNPTLGPYDYWAIEYGYKPLAPASERADLLKIASRSAEPQLAYGTDEDNFLGVDPESLQFDLGSDAVGFARQRVGIARELLDRQERRPLRPDQDYSVLRRSVSFALRDMARASSILTRQIGGVRTLRDFPGTGRDPLSPVPATEQRQALDLLASAFLSPDSFRLSPELQRKLAVDFEERTDAVFRGESATPTDFPYASLVLELQRGVLNALMSDTVASRVLDSQEKSPRDALGYTELLQKTQRAVWGELGSAGDIPLLRRELQREHLNRLANLLLRPTAVTRADVRAQLRSEAQQLLGRIEAASRRAGLTPQTRAHLQDSADTLSQALAAKLVRAGT